MNYAKNEIKNLGDARYSGYSLGAKAQTKVDIFR